jgi:hypothetical protein
MEREPRKGCLFITVGCLLFWGTILATCSCSSFHQAMEKNIVHGTELEVVSIDVRKNIVLMRGEVIYPKGHYYVAYPISKFKNLEQGMIFELKQK